MSEPFEELYQPLPSIEAYLERIGIEEAVDPSAAFLDKLIRSHQTHVPFENLDIYEKGLVPDLGIAALFDKIVARKRGGYCFELNALFAALLKAIGYDVRPCMGRVLLHPDPRPLVRHRANIVTIERERYLADVGFGGPMPPFALLMEDGSTRSDGRRTFTVRKHDDLWWNIGYAGDGETERVVLSVCDVPVGEEDFVPLSFYQAQAPDSVFRHNRMTNIRTESGALNLRNSTLTTYDGSEKTVTEFENEADIARLLREIFGIEI